ncbi:MAG: hypothetical protein R3Y41_06835 [Rikenellaceae bacterium]
MNLRDDAILKPTLYEYNHEGELIAKHLDVKDCMITMSLVGQSYGNSYIIRPYDNQNVINKIKDGVIAPYYYVDFEGQGVAPGSIYSSDGELDPRSYMATNRYKYPSMIAESKEYISMLIAGPEFSALTCIFNKRGLNSYKFVAPDGMSLPINPVVADEEYLYYVYNKSNINDVAERTDPLTKYFIERYGLLAAEDNPMLIGVEYSF